MLQLATAPSLIDGPFISLSAAAAQIHPPATSGWLRQRVKFLLRAWARPRYTRAWLTRLVQSDLAPLWAAHPRLATKLQRPYLCHAWGVPERFAALLGHYAVLPEMFSADARAKIYRGGLVLFRLRHAVSGRSIDVRLVYRDQFEKEGELTLELVELGSGLTLAGLTFTITCAGDRRAFIIGGLQASPDPRTRGLIHDVAKEMHGLRPKALALWCLQEFASGCLKQNLPHWQGVELQAVGDDQHIYRHWRKRREFAASYDEFWSESDGHRRSDGGWWLPRQMRERSRDELKPSRRKTHERRYAMLAALRPPLHAALNAFAPQSATSASLPAAVEFVYSGKEPAGREVAKTTKPAVQAVPPGLLALNHSF